MSDLNIAKQSAAESREAYHIRKEKLIDLLQKTIEVCRKETVSHESYQSYIEALESQIKSLEEGEFGIVVVGEFSAGKSTLLNAMMGERILPSFTNETTATVNFLRHISEAKNGEAGDVYYKDGKIVPLADRSLKTIEQYVSTKGDQVAENVAHLDLYLDSDFLKDNVMLVDSPGLNGIAEGHREITEQQIKKSHACIFLFNCDHPGSKTDFEFLHEVRQQVDCIFFVLNKIDMIKSDENETIESVIQSLKESYKKQFPEEKTVPEIWPIAAYPALAARSKEDLSYNGKKDFTEAERRQLEEKSNLGKFEDRLFQFLTQGEKAKEQLNAPIKQSAGILEAIQQDLRKEQKALEGKLDGEKLKEDIEKLDQQKLAYEKENQDARQRIQQSFEEDFNDTIDQLISKITQFSDQLLNQLDQCEEADEINEFKENYEAKYERKMRKLLNEADEKLLEKMKDLIRKEGSVQLQEIENQLGDSSDQMNLKFDEEMDTTELMVQVGLNKMEEETAQLRKELEEAEKAEEEAEDSYQEKRKKEKKKREIDQRLEELELRKQEIKNRMLPVENVVVVQGEKYVSRGGLLGGVLDCLIGEKRLETSEIKVTNAEEIARAREEWDSDLKEVNEKLQAAENEAQLYAECDSELEEKRRDRAEEKRKEKANAYKQKLAENSKKIDEEKKKAIRKAKKELREFCDDRLDEVERKTKRLMRDTGKNYVDMVSGLISANVKTKLEQAEGRLRELQERLKLSEEDKQKKLNELDASLGLIEETLGASAQIAEEINAIPVDEIQKVEL